MNTSKIRIESTIFKKEIQKLKSTTDVARELYEARKSACLLILVMMLSSLVCFSGFVYLMIQLIWR